MKLSKAVTAVLLFGTATLAVAQTQTESFADQFKTMQSLQSFGTYTFKPDPTLNSKPTDPLVKESFSDAFTQLQAESSNSGQWDSPAQESASAYANRSSDPLVGESFPDMFARMQAASSNSGEWNQPASRGTFARGPATNAPVAANDLEMSSLAQRIARAFYPAEGHPSQSN
ncbi:MAG TPA: hypothetical protein VGK44_00920 [Casimicrobiaceae bacterium]|jgi:hypothetical protein